MSTHQGKFVWHELLTTDLEAAAAFYRTVLGWETRDAGMSDHRYTLCSAGGTLVAGMMPTPEEARVKGVSPCWTGYIAVDDVEAFVNRVVDAGGGLLRAADDIPGVGRFAVVKDPQGAVVILFKAASDAPAPTASRGPGNVGWRELHAHDGASALDFYAGLFNWTLSRCIDMGPLGAYRIFAIDGADAGGVMTRTPDQPKSFWLYYFVVDAIEAAAERVAKAGGAVAYGPVQVPGGGSIVQCFDPQGAAFALFAPPH
ncbi:MAG TPA: VOC family protein [Methylocystis sp.]|nr:VOC family protein [Methylocystis sp.]